MLQNGTLLSVTGLGVTLNKHVVLHDITFTVNRNDTLAVIGPNGAGKTVLFKALLGIVPYEGTIEWKEGIKIGYVPQKLSISKDLPLTVSEFFALKKGNTKEVHKALESVGFNDHNSQKELQRSKLLLRKIGVLSGGELQRVLIAFALLGHPDVLLFDEPTAGIDMSTEETIYGLLHRLQAKENLTIILISHELEVVYRYANAVFCLNTEKVCFGPPRDVLDKKSLTDLYGGDTSMYTHDHLHHHL